MVSVPEKQHSAMEYAQLVKRIAYQLTARLPASVQVEDLIQAGMIGLMEAMSNYDEAQGAQFETYASQRIRGAMLDELRGIDWAPRSVRKTARGIEHAVSVLEQRLGYAPGERQIAEHLGMSLEEYQQLLADVRGHQIMYYEDFHDAAGDSAEFDQADDRPGQLQMLLDEGLHTALVRGIGELPEREKQVMAMYYQEELNLKEIGTVLNVSESRVCQLHSQAVVRLRSKMKDWLR